MFAHFTNVLIEKWLAIISAAIRVTSFARRASSFCRTLSRSDPHCDFSPCAAAVSSVTQGEALSPHALPALVVWGAGDPNIPVRYAEAQKRFFDAEVHVIEGAGHWPMIDEPDRTRALVLPFLRARVGAVAAQGQERGM